MPPPQPRRGYRVAEIPAPGDFHESGLPYCRTQFELPRFCYLQASDCSRG